MRRPPGLDEAQRVKSAMVAGQFDPRLQFEQRFARRNGMPLGGAQQAASDAMALLRRQDSQEDFSVTRLIGSLVQMLAVAAALWGLWALFNTDAGVSAIPRLTLAVFLQLLTLTIQLASRK